MNIIVAASGTRMTSSPISRRKRSAAVVLPPPGPPVRTMRQVLCPFFAIEIALAFKPADQPLKITNFRHTKFTKKEVTTNPSCATVDGRCKWPASHFTAIRPGKKPIAPMTANSRVKIIHSYSFGPMTFYFFLAGALGLER